MYVQPLQRPRICQRATRLGKPFSFDAETAAAMVADHFTITEVTTWDTPAVRLPDTAAVTLFLRGRCLEADEASRHAPRCQTHDDRNQARLPDLGSPT